MLWPVWLMASTADQYVKAQNGAVKLALRDLRTYWGGLDLSNGIATRNALEGFWPELLARYGEVTATLAADRFESLVGMPATMVRPVDADRANARMRWAIDPLFGNEGDAAARMAMLVDELVKQPGRSTMIRSASANRIRYARVPSGSDTCTFCLMLASRGAVYSSAASASTVGGKSLGGRDYKKLRQLGDTDEQRVAMMAGRKLRVANKAPLGSKFHSDCDCRTEPVASDGDMDRLKSDGYDPDALYGQWQNARDAEQTARDAKASTP